LPTPRRPALLLRNWGRCRLSSAAAKVCSARSWHGRVINFPALLAVARLLAFLNNDFSQRHITSLLAKWRTVLCLQMWEISAGMSTRSSKRPNGRRPAWRRASSRSALPYTGLETPIFRESVYELTHRVAEVEPLTRQRLPLRTSLRMAWAFYCRRSPFS
jgi:hypothetical protein